MREQVADTILSAAEQVIGEKGVDAASTAAIAARAGVAVGTLYNYFPDRERLIASLFGVRRTEILPRLAQIERAVAKLPVERRLREYLSGVLGVFEEQRPFMRCVIAIDPKSPSPAPVMTTIVDALVSILKPAVGKRADDYAHMVFGTMRALVRRRVELGEPFAPDADLIADTYLHGMVRK